MATHRMAGLVDIGPQTLWTGSWFVESIELILQAGTFPLRAERWVSPRTGQPFSHYLEVISHDGQRHRGADTMAITGCDSQQELPVTPALAAENSLTDD